MFLQDKLYKSSEVCDILGVSLRTLYRYIEDGKLGSVQLSSGRHRFTKDQIEKFLQLRPEERETSVENRDNTPHVGHLESNLEDKTSSVIKESDLISQPDIEDTSSKEDLNTETTVNNDNYAVSDLFGDNPVKEEPIREEEKSTLLSEDDIFRPMFYRCPFDDLRVIAKLIKRAGENASADYAFTGPAGLSLFYPIKAFDKLHFYFSPDQLDFWKLRLQLEESTIEDSNVVLIKADNVDVFSQSGERGGLKHVSIDRLKDDLKQLNMAEELKDFESKGY